jgi:hypothetical protein
MIGAYCVLALAFACFLAAILGWRPWQRWLRFPRLEIRVMGSGFLMATKQLGPADLPPQQVRLEYTRVHITNQEPDRRASIRNAYLIAPSEDARVPFCLFSPPDSPIRPVMSGSQTLRPLEFAIDLGPQETKSGDLIFEISEPDTQFLVNSEHPSTGGRIELHDAVTGKMACFPVNTLATFSRGHGLRPTTLAESPAEKHGRGAGTAPLARAARLGRSVAWPHHNQQERAERRLRPPMNSYHTQTWPLTAATAAATAPASDQQRAERIGVGLLRPAQLDILQHVAHGARMPAPAVRCGRIPDRCGPPVGPVVVAPIWRIITWR